MIPAMSTPLAAIVTPEPPAADETPGITQTQSAVVMAGQAVSEMPASTETQASAETPASIQTDDMTSGEVIFTMPPATEYCLRCSKDLHNLEGLKCTRPSAYVKCRECSRKRKPCETIPEEFLSRFSEVHRLLRKAKLSDLPLAEYEKARASYKTDVESYLKKTGSPSKSARVAPAASSQSDTNSLLRTLISEVRGLRNDFRSRVCLTRSPIMSWTRCRGSG